MPCGGKFATPRISRPSRGPLDSPSCFPRLLIGSTRRQFHLCGRIPCTNVILWSSLPQWFGSNVLPDSLATSDKQLLSYPQIPVRFKTFPDPKLPNPAPFRFVVSSCMKPNFPYVPFKGDRIKGMDLLADYLWPDDSTRTIIPSTAPSAPLQHRDKNTINHFDRTAPSVPAEFMLFLGDFVYADVPYYSGDNLDAYRRLYRRNYQSPSFRRVYERLRRLQVSTF